MEFERNNLVIEDARLIFRNFAGRGDRYNAVGNRNFGVIIRDIELAEELKKKGWNVKPLRAKDDPDEITGYWLKVKVNYNSRKEPRIFILCGNTKTLLDEDTVGELDNADIVSVDIEISGYTPSDESKQWRMNGTVGVSAYVQNMWVTVRRSALEEKYASMGQMSMFDEPDDNGDDLPF